MLAEWNPTPSMDASSATDTSPSPSCSAKKKASSAVSATPNEEKTAKNAAAKSEFPIVLEFKVEVIVGFAVVGDVIVGTEAVISNGVADILALVAVEVEVLVAVEFAVAVSVLLLV